MIYSANVSKVKNNWKQFAFFETLSCSTHESPCKFWVKTIRIKCVTSPLVVLHALHVRTGRSIAFSGLQLHAELHFTQLRISRFSQLQTKTRKMCSVLTGLKNRAPEERSAVPPQNFQSFSDQETLRSPLFTSRSEVALCQSQWNPTLRKNSSHP